jgi:predicted enzyme related to lactoylglutathione lyase
MSERSSYEPGTPSWADLSTTDLQGALSFYGGLFGWEFEDAGEEAGHYHQAVVRGKRIAGIGPTPPGAPPFAAWTTYLSGTDVDAHAAAIEDAGGQVLMGPIEIFEEGRMLIGQDTAGAAFGIWEPGRHAGAQLVNENATMTWNELLTRDIDAAAGFYAAIFDFELEDLPETADGSYKMLKVGGRVVGGMWAMSDEVPAEVPPHWMTYFHLDDVDAGFERVRELGGEVLREPMDSPYGRFAPVRDPQGATFSLIRGTAQE